MASTATNNNNQDQRLRPPHEIVLVQDLSDETSSSSRSSTPSSGPPSPNNNNNSRSSTSNGRQQVDQQRRRSAASTTMTTTPSRPRSHSTMSLLDSMERRTQRTYRYGIGLVCVGATLNWLGFAQGHGYVDPLRYLGVACVISGSFCVCMAMCRWLGKPISSVSSHRISRFQDDQSNNGDVHVINVSVPMYMPSSLGNNMNDEFRQVKPPDYDIVVANTEPPPYDEAIKLSPNALSAPASPSVPIGNANRLTNTSSGNNNYFSLSSSTSSSNLYQSPHRLGVGGKDPLPTVSSCSNSSSLLCLANNNCSPPPPYKSTNDICCYNIPVSSTNNVPFPFSTSTSSSTSTTAPTQSNVDQFNNNTIDPTKNRSNSNTKNSCRKFSIPSSTRNKDDFIP